MWKLLKNFLMEVRLRLSSMKQPYIYNKMDDKWLTSLKYDKRGY